VIIPHFDKYPLLTQKQADLLLFKPAVDLINDGEHLTPEGIIKIVSIKASINNGLSGDLNQAFTGIIPVKRPIVQTSLIDPHWLAGFVDAEANFQCVVRKHATHKTGYQILLSFTLTQHSRDLDLMVRIKEYLGCVKVYTLANHPVARLYVARQSYISNIPFFKKYPLQGSKKLDFEDFSLIEEMITNKLHITEEGLEKINVIKNRMNSKRIHEN
jgi:hypothetical protein